MLNEKIAKLINEQINKEFYSGYLYLDFANYYADEGLDGFAHWYEIQAMEERDHAMMMRRYLIDNGIRVTFDAIDKPDKVFKGLSDPLEAIPRLVYKRTGRGGEERGRYGQENAVVRTRRKGLIRSQSGAFRKSLHAFRKRSRNVITYLYNFKIRPNVSDGFLLFGLYFVNARVF